MKRILIIGQGIAGTLLALALRRKGARVQIAEADYPDPASSVAAGIINPITGKRFVKSWRFDDFFPVARDTYQHLEQVLGIRIWHEQPIVRLLSAPEEINNWSARCALPEYSGYLETLNTTDAWSPYVKPEFSFGRILKAARVEFAPLIKALREKARAEGWLTEKPIDYTEIAERSKSFDHIIFCEGFRAQQNPFFPNLPWQLAKGEALWIRFSDRRTDFIQSMVKKNMMLVPVGDGVFWAGGSYNWTFEDTLPSEGERAYILNGLADMLQASFEVIDHRAAIRPTVKDRRPFLGLHRDNPVLGIFNGLGTKGALLAPYWAAHFAGHLLDGAPLDPDVDIRRISSFS